MANPRLKNGYIAFANDFWKAFIRVGSLEDRVYKAILWECWGWADRREAKEPVPITRGRISELTGIKHKGRISSLTAKLVEKNLIEKHTSGPLETCCYWPVQDYDLWDISREDQSESEPSQNQELRHKSEPMTSHIRRTQPSHNSEPTPSLHENNNKTKENKQRYHPLYKTYQDVFAYDIPNNEKALANRKFRELEELQEYDEAKAISIVKLWRQHSFNKWRAENPDRSFPNVGYVAGIIKNCLQSGKLPGGRVIQRDQPDDSHSQEERDRLWFEALAAGHSKDEAAIYADSYGQIVPWQTREERKLVANA